MKKILILIIVLSALFGLSIVFLKIKNIRTADPKATTEDSNETEYGLILETPRPNSALLSPVRISGEAVGQWFFEASFTAELISSEGEVLSTAILTAEGEWMTEELVPFSGELEFDNAISGSGELLLRSANPSGLPENQKIFSIPVKY